MAETPAHNEEMEDLMGTEVFVSGVEERQLQRIDHAADGVDDSSGQQPSKCCRRQGVDNLAEGQYTYPAHGDVNDGGEPLGTGDPAGLDDDTGQSDSPDKSQHTPSGSVTQHYHAYRCIGSGNQDENHHMVNLAKHLIHLW